MGTGVWEKIWKKQMYSAHIRKKILGIKKKERLSFVEAGKRFGMSAKVMLRTFLEIILHNSFLSI